MTSHDHRPLDSFLCPGCRGHIQARLGVTRRNDNYGWWIVKCEHCNHHFSRSVGDGVRGSAIARGGAIERTCHGDEFQAAAVEKLVATMNEENP